MTLPPALTRHPNFLLWRKEPSSSGRATKVPYSAITKRKASSTSSSDWTSLTEAIAALTPAFSGIGFVFTKDLHLTGIDLDDSIDLPEGTDPSDLSAILLVGSLKPWAAYLLASFAGAYMEVSPSGTGIKLWCGGNLPGNGIKRYVGPDNKPTASQADSIGAVEMYDTGRYFAVTGHSVYIDGDHLSPQPNPPDPLDLQDQVTKLYEVLRAVGAPRQATHAPGEEFPFVPEGSRHAFLNTSAARLRNMGLGRPELLASLLAINEARCDPPKDTAVVARIVDWFMTKEPGRWAVIPEPQEVVRRGPELYNSGFPKPHVNGHAANDGLSTAAGDAYPEVTNPEVTNPEVTNPSATLASIIDSIIESKDVSRAYSRDLFRAAAEATLEDRSAAFVRLNTTFKAYFEKKKWSECLNEALAKNRASRVVVNSSPDWQSQLILSEKGSVVPCYENAALIAENSDDWSGVLGYNEFTGGHVVIAEGPYPVTAKPGQEIEDHFDTEVTRWFERQHLIIKPEMARRTVDRMARMNSFHPVRDYLNGLPQWDGTSRIDSWLFNYCGVSRQLKDADGEAQFNLFASEAGARFLISAVARIFEPGCKADHVLMLEGKTGIGKSTAVRILAGEEFFTDQLSDLGSQTASMQIRGIWIAEIAELHALSRAEREKAKAFITQTFERFRLPYGRRITTFQRQCVFIGTTESSEWNTDERGARRFWPVLCAGRINTDGLRQDRDQIWAEALFRYREGEKWHIYSEKTLKIAQEEQAARYVGDAWHSVVMEKAESLAGPSGHLGASVEAILDRIGIPLERRDQTSLNRVSRVLRFERWSRQQYRDEYGKRIWKYVPPNVEAALIEAAQKASQATLDLE